MFCRGAGVFLITRNYIIKASFSIADFAMLPNCVPFLTGNALHSWLQPFSVYLWVAILGTCNLILMVVWWLDRKSPSGHHRIFKESDENGFTMLGL